MSLFPKKVEYPFKCHVSRHENVHSLLSCNSRMVWNIDVRLVLL